LFIEKQHGFFVLQRIDSAKRKGTIAVVHQYCIANNAGRTLVSNDG
jgi:hypothetical protein